MDTPATKTELIDQIRRERAAWEALLADVGEARMSRPGVAGDWTLKDVAAHLTAWRQHAVVRLQAAQRGERPAPAPWIAEVDSSDDDPINDWIYRAHRDRPLAEVLRDSRESLEQLEAAVQALSEQDLTDPQRFPWMEGVALGETISGNSMDHFYDDHEPTIRAWLAQQPD